MKATEANLLRFLGSPKQLIIPIYQRTYSWTKAQCQQLWDDVLRAAEDDSTPAHFVGSVVYIHEGVYQDSAIPPLLVIDGQQRLTTVSLLLLALANAISNGIYSTRSREEIVESYLINRYGKGEQRHKIKLTRSDKETFYSLLEDRELPLQPSHHIKDNYRFFQDAIDRSGLRLDTIFKGMMKLVIVDVALDAYKDNPQLIFESLNSTGLDLSQADLIRNFVLMGLPAVQQEELYTKFWYPMEQKFGQTENSNLFDRFMRDYLTVKSESGAIPNIGRVYSAFKEYVRGKDTSVVVADVALFSSYFARLAYPYRNDDKGIREVMRSINTLEVYVAYPLLLEVFEDYERHKLLDRDEFVQVLELVESYVFRRAIVGIPTNSMNKTFAQFKRSIRKDDYLNSIKAAFILLEGARRFPRDEEFWTEFMLKDIYNLSRRRNYLLDKLENYGRKERVHTEEYTIEHIMPQNPNLTQTWKLMLGPEWKSIREKYLHTIGNLTLTGYNAELSDRSFREKCEIKGGFKESPLRLNQGLAQFETWGPKQIEQRAEMLAEIANKIWAYPDIKSEVIKKYQTKSEGSTYTLEQHHLQLQGEMRTLFDGLRTRILNLDSAVHEEIMAKHIAYKTDTNFADIVPQTKRLWLYLNLEFDDINDPQGKCNDVSNKGHWGNGDVQFEVKSQSDIEYALFLIKQSYTKHSDLVII